MVPPTFSPPLGRGLVAAANGCLRGHLLFRLMRRFDGRLTGGVRFGSGLARSQSGLASLFAVPRILVPVCACMCSFYEW